MEYPVPDPCGCEVYILPSLNTGLQVPCVIPCPIHAPHRRCPRRSFREAKKALKEQQARLWPFI